MTKSIREELAVLIRDGTGCGVSVAEATVFCDDTKLWDCSSECGCKNAANAILTALPSLGYAKRDEALEEAAMVAETATALTYDNWTTSAQSGFDTGTRKAAMAVRFLKAAASQEKP